MLHIEQISGVLHVLVSDTAMTLTHVVTFNISIFKNYYQCIHVIVSVRGCFNASQAKGNTYIYHYIYCESQMKISFIFYT
jgi:hypothetical protein